MNVHAAQALHDFVHVYNNHDSSFTRMMQRWRRDSPQGSEPITAEDRGVMIQANNVEGHGLNYFSLLTLFLSQSNHFLSSPLLPYR